MYTSHSSNTLSTILRSSLLVVIASLYMPSAHAQSPESGTLAESFAYHWPAATDAQMSAIAIQEQLKGAMGGGAASSEPLLGASGTSENCDTQICIFNNTTTTSNTEVTGNNDTTNPKTTADPTQLDKIGTINEGGH